jgi:hypothetical protein
MVPMDFKKTTKKFVSTTMSNEAAQLIFLSGVQQEVSFSRFICIIPNRYSAQRGFGRVWKARGWLAGSWG